MVNEVCGGPQAAEAPPRLASGAASVHSLLLRNVAVFFGRKRRAFVADDPESLDQACPALGRHYHAVDIAAGGGNIGVIERPAVVVDNLLAFGHRVGGFLDLAAENDVCRALGAHDRDLGRGPRKGEVGPKVA